MREKDKKEDFIKKAISVHGNKYDYSKVEYKGCCEKVTIICPIHGEFNQTPRSHIRGSGCPECAKIKVAGSKRKRLSKLIAEFNKKHHGRYDYSGIKEEEYQSNKSKLPIICPVHGVFYQSVSKHLSGQGCPKCYGNIKKSVEDFINEARKVHGDEYDYSKVDYVNTNTKVEIICREHGSFWQTPKNHTARKQGCPECAKAKIGESITKPFEKFVAEASKVHNGKYFYNIKGYVNSSSKIDIYCPKHGLFKQNASSHLQGCGCPKCATEQTTEKIWNIYSKEFIKRAKQIHGDKYDYSKADFKKFKEKVTIICPIHGEFEQMPDKHIYGKCGCPKCAKTYQPTTEEFVERSSGIHKNKYDYSKVEYVDAHTKVCIICPDHGEFWQTPNGHIKGNGCPRCAKIISKPEVEITDFIKSIHEGEILNNVRNVIAPQELDIYVPDKKIAIEYNGLTWHSEEYNKDKGYHLSKLERCNEKGIKLISIFEDEWINRKEIVLGKIRHLLGKEGNKERAYARKCWAMEISKEEAMDFLEQNHIQGYVPSTIYLGCFFNGSLVGVMAFKKEKEEGSWELTRFATDINRVCCGVGGKLFKYFVGSYNPLHIKSFADRRWTLDKKDNLYTKLGFTLESILKPDYRYVNGFNREHKFGYRKQVLMRKYPDAGLNMGMTEKEMCDALGFYRIWDCGLLKFVWEATV